MSVKFDPISCLFDYIEFFIWNQLALNYEILRIFSLTPVLGILCLYNILHMYARIKEEIPIMLPLCLKEMHAVNYFLLLVNKITITIAILLAQVIFKHC